MIAGSDIPDLLDCVDASTLRVVAPTPIIFLCGGPTSVSSKESLSLRDAFLKVSHRPALSKYTSVLAEDVNIFVPEGRYKDFLRMEADIAEVSELVVLFSESYGSAVELGAFALVDEIAERLLVVIDDKNFGRESFVKYGPILYLQNTFGESSVFVLDRFGLGFDRIEDVSKINLDEFAVRIEQALGVRLETLRQPSTFNANKNGHIVKVTTGLLQHFGALTADEVREELGKLGIVKSLDEIGSYLKCAEIAKWVKSFRQGFTTYFIATAARDALIYRFRSGVAPIDKARWRSDILAYWKAHEAQRHRTILSVRGARS